MQPRGELDDSDLAGLVEIFYARVRQDPLIGPVFNDAIDDWPQHLERLSAFWSSVMLTSGRYKGQPVPAHFRHRARIEPRMFTRWLQLWQEVTDERMTPDAAAALQAKARRIGESLQLALGFDPNAPPPPRRDTGIAVSSAGQPAGQKARVRQ